ncbi:hypothetical protein [Deinococcus cellulosilyticus]|uniref:hypothetical protein n=1 Tax=Deinococcus cellulosilyticus TaxID=401558 RepID=UPI00361FFD39
MAYKTLTGTNSFSVTIPNFPLGNQTKSIADIEAAIQRVLNNTVALNTTAVKTSGNFTLSGHLTIPNATAEGHAVNLGQMTDAIAAALGGISATPGDPGGPIYDSGGIRYVKRSNGEMEAWVDQAAFVNAEGSYTLALPAGFTSVKNVQVTTILQTPNTAGEFMFQLISFDTSDVVLYCQKLQDGSPNPVKATIRVIGTWN